MDREREICPPGDRVTDRRADRACQFGRAEPIHLLVWVHPICVDDHLGPPQMGRANERIAMAAVSPLAPARFPELMPLAGVRLATFPCGIRYSGRDDLMLAELAEGS